MRRPATPTLENSAGCSPLIFSFLTMHELARQQVVSHMVRKRTLDSMRVRRVVRLEAAYGDAARWLDKVLELCPSITTVLLSDGLDTTAILEGAIASNLPNPVDFILLAYCDNDGVPLPLPPSSRTWLHNATTKRQLELLSVLVQDERLSHADRSSPGDESALHNTALQETALHAACHRGFEKEARLLLTHTNLLNAADREGTTPLHQAVCARREDFVNMLLDSPGVDVNASDNSGNSVLHAACDAYASMPDVVERLLRDMNVDLNVENEHGQTPLHSAIIVNDLEVSKKILLSRRADELKLSCPDRYGDTPLHNAVLYGLSGVVSLLLERRDIGDVNAPTSHGETVMDIAAKNLAAVLEGTRLSEEQRQSFLETFALLLSDERICVSEDKRQGILDLASRAGLGEFVEQFLARQSCSTLGEC